MAPCRVTMTDAMKDMQNEEARFKGRKSFAYAVLTRIKAENSAAFMSGRAASRATTPQVTMWVIKEQYDLGFEASCSRL